MRVKKRDGRWVEWNRQLIVRAMLMAFHEVGEAVARDEVEKLARHVEEQTRSAHGRPCPDCAYSASLTPACARCGATAIEMTSDPSVEEIQDVVERVLMSSHPDVAKAYILFRNRRAELRAQRLSPDPSAIRDYIHAAKYAAYDKEKRRRETYEESAERVRRMHLERYAEVEEARTAIDDAWESIVRREILPSMRSMQFGGRPILERNVRMYNCAFSLADRLRFFGECMWVLLAGCGAGFSVQHQHVEQLPPVRGFDPRRVSHHAVEDSCMGWSDAVSHLARCAFLTGETPEFAYHLIRPEGAPLSSGGKAPGHLGLKRALEAIREILAGAAGRQLRPIEVFDVVCWIASAVLAGGIRRASLICLFSIDDTEMMLAKAHGNFRPTGHRDGPHNSQRENANISAACHRERTTWAQFKRLTSLSREWGEPGFYFTVDLDYGANPCGEIGLNPRLRKGYPDQDRSLDFDWRAYKRIQDDCAANRVPDRPVSHPPAMYAEATYGHTTGWQFCNLVEVNCATVRDRADFVRRVRRAAVVATLQAGYDRFWYLGPVTEEVARREALIGVGLTGMQDRPDVALDPEAQREAAAAVLYENDRVAKMIGISPASRCCTVKPSGTASLELGCVGSGIHQHHARRYFRRVTANANEVPFLHFRRANPHMCRPKPNGDWVITFPVQAPDGAGTVKSTPAIEFMDQVFSTFENWVVPGQRPRGEEVSPGLHHNVSCTVAYDPAEWDEVVEHAWRNRHRVGAMTFLPNMSDKAFPFAPREEVSTDDDEAAWRALIALQRPVDWNATIEEDDGTAPAPACEGPLCEVSRKG